MTRVRKFSLIIIFLWFSNSIGATAMDAPPQERDANGGEIQYKARQTRKQELDLEKTTKYFRNFEKHLEGKNTPLFAFYKTYSLLALEAEISPEDKKKTIDYIVSCQRQDGGFAADAAQQRESNIVLTYFAIGCLDLLHSLDAISLKKTTDFLLSLYHKNGGASWKIKIIVIFQADGA